MDVVFICYGLDSYNGFISSIYIDKDILSKLEVILSKYNIDYRVNDLQGPFQLSLSKHVSIAKVICKLKLSLPHLYTRWTPIYNNYLCLYGEEVALHKSVKHEYKYLKARYNIDRVISSCNKGGINGVILKDGDILNLPLSLTLDRYIGMRLAYSMGIVMQTYRFRRKENAIIG
jgi:hypothetical protein